MHRLFKRQTKALIRLRVSAGAGRTYRIGNIMSWLPIDFSYAFVFKYKIEPVHDISNNVACATSNASDQPAHTHSLIRASACRLNIQ